VGREKIVSSAKLKEETNRLKRNGEKVVFTNGCFDILHVGHVRYLGEAKKLGDVLIVALNSDASVRKIKGVKRPVLPEDERAEILASLSMVDYVIIFEDETPLALIESLKPDVLVKGGDWEIENVVGREAVRDGGGKIEIIPVVKGASTTNIIEKIIKIHCLNL
jgi:D-beta-D-heptose 7-phosphate kinase/D-beta-D-heptose 1-phosphate adenosyltransferase